MGLTGHVPMTLACPQVQARSLGHSEQGQPHTGAGRVRGGGAGPKGGCEPPADSTPVLGAIGACLKPWPWKSSPARRWQGPGGGWWGRWQERAGLGGRRCGHSSPVPRRRGLPLPSSPPGGCLLAGMPLCKSRPN